MSTIPQKILEVIEKNGSKNALYYKESGQYHGVPYTQLKSDIKFFSSGLLSLGLTPGDKVVLVSENRPEWVISDISIMQLGGINVPLFVNSSPEDMEYIIEHSEAKFLIASNATIVKKLEAVKGSLGSLCSIITMETLSSDVVDVLSMTDVKSSGHNDIEKNQPEIEKRLLGLKSTDTASIIYTSGTTGKPKGVMLSHENFLSNVDACTRRVDLSEINSCLSFLPLCHVLERTAGYYTTFLSGIAIWYAESVETVPDNLVEAKPDLAVSVPRLYEKMYAKVIDAVEKGSPVKKKIFSWAVKTGKAYFHNQIAGNAQPGLLSLHKKIAAKLVFDKLKVKLGGNLKFFISGGAPLSKDIAEFFGSAGILIYEGYGLTETSPVLAVNSQMGLSLGTVGRPLDNVEVKIAEDGEILAKGPNIMKGYFKNDEASKEIIDGEGWLHTGDIGELEDGYLKITDRKKDLIVTANGKNVAPQILENLLKLDPFITEAAVYGDKQSYLVALLVPDFEKLKELAEEKEINYKDMAELVQKYDVLEYFLERVDACQADLSGYHQVKKITLLAEDFTIDNAELTPSLKLKRRVVGEKHKKLIEKMYNN
ncbi:MAG: long-chain fatty acid--CoA ligase [Fibrobacteria bacterium]|nr:long-chain fatty acid--CoA ligase [Fibrobacteria bacterium]